MNPQENPTLSPNQEDSAQTPAPSQPDLSQPAQKKRNLLIVGIVALVVVLVGAGMLIMSMSNKGGNARKPAKLLSVGSHSYNYACSVIDKKMLQDTFKITGTFETQAEKFATPPAKKSGDYDLSKDLEKDEPVSSSCLFNLEPTETGLARTLSLSLEQYVDEKVAAKEFEAVFKDSKDNYSQPALVTELPSLKGQAFLLPPEPDAVEPTFFVYALKDNTLVVFGYSPSEEDADPQGLALKYNTGQILSRTDGLMSDIFSNLDNSKKATVAQDFNGIVKNGDKPLVDACSQLDLGQAEATFNVEASHTDVIVANSLKIYETPTDPEKKDQKPLSTIFSACSFNFRRDADKTAQEKAKKDNKDLKLDLTQRFPHRVQMIIVGFKNDKDATQGFDSAKETSSANGDASSVKGLGDDAFKVNSKDEGEEGTQIDTYTVRRGNLIFASDISQIKTKTPYTTSNAAVTDEQMKKLFKQLSGGVKQ